MAKRYVLLDRDGTIIEDKDYISNPSDVVLLQGAAKGLRQLQRLGYGLIVISNQSGVGRKMFDEESVHAVNNEMIRQLKNEGVTLDGIYFCPHAPEENCKCRKPKTALAEEAARVYGFNLDKTIVIGDKASDIEMGKSLHATTVLVKTGKGFEEERKCSPDMIADNILSASRMIGLINLMDEMKDLETKLLRTDDSKCTRETMGYDLLRCF